MFRTLKVNWQALIFVVCTCACLAVVELSQTLTARNVQLKEVRVAASNLSQAAAKQAQDAIKQSDTVLVGMVERIENEEVDPASLDRLHRLLTLRAAELGLISGLFIYDASGKWLVTSMEDAPKNLNNADRDYFAFHRANASRGAHIGPPVRSRSTGEWVIPVSRRINKQDGTFGGVALATIRIDFFKTFYDSLDTGESGAILLGLDNGTMLLRRPFNDGFVGKSMDSSPVFQRYKVHGDNGTLMLKSSQDGVVRIISYRKVPDYPLFVVAALSRDEMLAAWMHATVVHIAGVGVLIVILGIFGWRLARQISLRSIAEEKLLATQKDLEQVNKTLQRLALEDALTGLANRRQFDASIHNEVARAARHGGTLALIMIDVDNFKQFNDRYGHAAGDACLQAISKAIRATAPGRPGDVVARYGGEEIAVILPGTDLCGAMAVAERIRRVVADLQLPHAKNVEGIVTISAGIESISVQRGTEPTHLIVAADKSLYVAKARGRNRVAHYRDGLC